MKNFVIDTNVLVAGLRSKQGAAHQVLRKMIAGELRFFVSASLFFEYEAVLKRPEQLAVSKLTTAEIDLILDTIALQAIPKMPYFLWRPCLKDANDDMILELAVVAKADAIVTFNIKDFKPAKLFGIQVINPEDFLRSIK